MTEVEEKVELVEKVEKVEEVKEVEEVEEVKEVEEVEEKIELVEKQSRNEYLHSLLEGDQTIVGIEDHRNIINIYNHCSAAVKEAFDSDSTNNMDSWDFSDWVKIILPIVKAIEKYNSSNEKGEYKKTVAIIVTMCVIVKDLETSEENKKLLINAVDSYLKPSIDVIVFMINQSGSNIFKKCCPCCF